MSELGAGDCTEVDVVGREGLVGAGIAEEDEIAIAVREQGDERQSGGRLPRMLQGADVDPVGFKRAGQKTAELDRRRPCP